MPASSCSSSTHFCSHFIRKPKRGEQQQGSNNTMKPQQDHRKLSNGSEAKERVVRYRECRKNHAASIGGYAVDGCREFMASGEEGTSAALRCAACNCHRSFHKREVESEAVCDCSSDSTSRR